uniref:Zonadhesin-like n=1 Tax=Gouania willdenowi TaxID=441366 RepID=A0A8C5G2Y6_GOUWI
MLGEVCTDLLVTVVLLFLTLSGTQCRNQNDFSFVTLPKRANSEYVTQCFYETGDAWVCDWTRTQRITDDVSVNLFVSGPLGIEGEACLEFWYLTSATAGGSELHVFLKSNNGLEDIWSTSFMPKVSWRQVFVPLTLTEQGSQVVFEVIQSGPMEDVEFKQIGVRRGSCGPQCEPNTEFWTDQSTHCNCPSGELTCFPSQCAEGQNCDPHREASKDVSAYGMCTIHSHTDCSTFDGVIFRFMAPCTYVLAQTCSPTDDLPVFRVTVVNEQNDNATLPIVQRIYVDMEDIRVTLLRRQTQRVVVNGVRKKLPLSLGNDTIHINSNPAAIILETSFGLSVLYDNAGAVRVSLLSEYSDKVCGLCGNFNYLKADDFNQPDGSTAKDPTALAKSWQSGESASSCETILVPQRCDPEEEAMYASEVYCGGLTSSSGPFTDCLSVLGAESYYRACMVGMCASHGDPVVLCETLEAYAGICEEAGVTVAKWRNSTSCSLQCGENSHYNSCADGCPEVCSSWDLTGSCGSCEERCECDPGFKLSGGKCVPSEDCGCWHDGKHYDKGETVILGDCEQKCQCMGDDIKQCTQMQCQDSEVCKVKGGINGCFPFQPATCSVYGDPHYVTFDKWVYDFQGGCSYTLTTTCADDSQVQFSVIGHNTHPPLHNFTRSKLEAVTLQIEDQYLTLHQSGHVYVNESDVPLPYSTSGTFGSVKVDRKNKYIILEATFGLRMMIDGENRLFLQVDERLKYELCGLCGTYSGHQDDDFVTPGGQNVTDSFEFGDSWRVADNTECVIHPDDPRLCDNAENNEAYYACSSLFADGFRACHEHIHPSIYLSSCVYDYCSTNGDLHTFCESLKSYVASCQVAGVNLSHWETGTACAGPTSTSPSFTFPQTVEPTTDQTGAPSTFPQTTTPRPSSTLDPTVCPLNCDFENNLCGWEQLIQDSFDWTRYSGPTPSKLSGPKHDHTTGAGFFMYIEGNRATHGDSARLMSSTCNFNGPLCLHFWYHMFGSAQAMALNIYLVEGNRATKIWSRQHSQGSNWLPGNVNISSSSPFQILVEGIRGSTDQSDVAIDDISIHLGLCVALPDQVIGSVQPATTAVALPPHHICDLNCTFDSGLCEWNQMMTDHFDWTWKSGSTPTLITGPSADHTGDGHYLYIEASKVTHGDTARLISSECSNSGPQCLQFWYHMYGSADTMGLHVYILQNRLADAVFWKRNNQGNVWHLAQVDIKITGPFQIIFEGRRGSNEQSDVAIDDVKLYEGPCWNVNPVVTTVPLISARSTTAPPSVPLPSMSASEPSTVISTQPSVCQLQCDFEQDLCQWHQLLTDVFDWTRHSGSTHTMTTGPSADHTTGDGHYLYIEANSASYGDTARLISSECSDSGPQCLQFWYHMYGSADTMGLNVYVVQNRRAEAVWSKRNNQKNTWHLAQVDIQIPTAFQIIFEGRIGSNDQSDVAIDDVSLYRGHCAEPTTTAKPQPVTTTQPELSTGKPHPPTSAQPQPTTTRSQPSTTTRPEPTTAKPQPPTSVQPEPTTAKPQPPTSVQPEPTTAKPQPPTSVQPEPTTVRPQPPTSVQPEPTEIRPQPPTTVQPESTTVRPQPPTTVQPEPTTVRPQPPTTVQPEPTTARPQPPTTVQPEPTTVRPQPPTTVQPEPTTARPQPPTTVQPEPTTVRPHPPTTVQPEPTTARPQPPTTVQPEPTTVRPQPPTTVQPEPTTARPQPPTTVQPESTTARPQPPTTVQPESTTARPQPPTTVQPEPTTARPQPSTTTQPEPTTTRPQPPTTVQPEPTTVRPQPPTTVQPEPTTARPQPPTTVQPESTTARPQPPTSVQPEPTTVRPHPPTTVQPEPTTARPQPPTTVQPEPTTVRPQPPTTVQPEPTTARPQPPTTVQPESTTARPQPPTTVQPESTTARPQPPTTVQPEPTTARPQPPTTVQPESTTARPQPPTTVQPEPTTVRPQPPTTVQPEPTTARPQPPTTVQPESTTARPQPPTTVQPESTTDRPQPPTTVQPESTTARPQPPTTVQPEPTTAKPQPLTTVHPEPTTVRPQPPTTVQPEPTTARPQPPTTVQPEPTTARPQPPTTVQPEPTTARPQPPATTAPSCSRNSHYTPCMPSCPRTCDFLNGHPDCNENQQSCVAGCACDEGYVKTLRGNCIPIQLCGCLDEDGNAYHFNEVWYTNHCKQKCECERNRGRGRIDCDDQEECDRNAVCLQNENGKYHCNKTQGFGKCTIDEDSEYKTFDRKRYSFNGEHTYVLVRTKGLTGDLPDFYIEGTYIRISDDDSSSKEHHRHRHSHEESEEDDSEEHKHHRLQELRITVYNHIVSLRKHGQLMVDGKKRDTPVSPTEGLTIRKQSSRIYLQTEFGLSVEFDKNYEAEIILPRLYETRLEGLCGNFDGHKHNDWMKPDSSLAEDIEDFEESWTV